MKICGQRRQIRMGPVRKRTRIESIENINQIEYLPLVDTTGLIEKVRAAIYLSLDELWSVPTDNTLIATFLDPRFKHFNWATLDEHDKALQLVKIKYDALKSSLHIPDDTELTEDKD